MRDQNNTTILGTIIDQVQVSNIQGQNGNNSLVAKTRLGFVDENNGKTFTSSFWCEAWNEAGQRLASIPVGNRIIAIGKYKNYSYNGQNNEKKFGTKITLFDLGDAGPSKTLGAFNKNNQQGGYQNNQQGSSNRGGGSYQNNSSGGSYQKNNNNSGAPAGSTPMNGGQQNQGNGQTPLGTGMYANQNAQNQGQGQNQNQNQANGQQSSGQNFGPPPGFDQDDKIPF